jgi:hypothetical protein
MFSERFGWRLGAVGAGWVCLCGGGSGASWMNDPVAEGSGQEDAGRSIVTGHGAWLRTEVSR